MITPRNTHIDNISLELIQMLIPMCSWYKWQPEARLWYPRDTTHNHYIPYPESTIALFSNYLLWCPCDHYLEFVTCDCLVVKISSYKKNIVPWSCLWFSGGSGAKDKDCSVTFIKGVMLCSCKNSKSLNIRYYWSRDLWGHPMCPRLLLPPFEPVSPRSFFSYFLAPCINTYAFTMLQVACFITLHAKHLSMWQDDQAKRGMLAKYCILARSNTLSGMENL
jgi:hypothetical protein